MTQSALTFRDAAERAVAEWIRSWRETAGPDAQRPALAFAGVLGAEAVSMQREGVPIAEMVRIFSAAGRDGESPSGVPTSWTLDGVARALRGVAVEWREGIR